MVVNGDRNSGSVVLVLRWKSQPIDQNGPFLVLVLGIASTSDVVLEEFSRIECVKRKEDQKGSSGHRCRVVESDIGKYERNCKFKNRRDI
jgi:hypothetical protein